MVFGYKGLVALAAAAMLTACGGGGGGGGGGSGAPAPVASVNPFDVRTGLAALATGGFSKLFTISGTCSGTFNLADTVATTSVTFEGSAAFSGTETGILNLFGCTGSGTTTTTRYYSNPGYTPVGTSSSSSYSLVFVTTPFPTAGHVGDTGTYGHTNLYSDNTKVTPTGSQTLSYAINADTASTAILNLITKTYNTGAVLISTEQDYYRISATGIVTPIGLDVQYANGSTTHIVGN